MSESIEFYLEDGPEMTGYLLLTLGEKLYMFTAQVSEVTKLVDSVEFYLEYGLEMTIPH